MNLFREHNRIRNNFVLRRFFSSTFLENPLIANVILSNQDEEVVVRTKRKFVDQTKIRVAGGNGGSGCISFRHLAPGKKQPDGGHGGAGGNVIFVADNSVRSLSFGRHHFNGGHGVHGSGDDKKGRNGTDTIVRVPCGTVVKRIHRKIIIDESEDDESEDEDDSEDEDEDSGSGATTSYYHENEIVCDLDIHNASFLAAQGGKPGLGNRILGGRRPNPNRPNVSLKAKGAPGEIAFYELELKTIADFGLVGFPNAGKSTFLGAISKAKPKVAPYPFTTLHPYLGIVEYEDLKRITVADLPGLVEGAHRNIGLGHDFLRHIEKTKALMYVLDTAGTEGRNPVDDFFQLQKELELYAQGITSRPSLILANKMDAEGASTALQQLRRSTSIPIIPVSAEHEVDLEIAIHSMRKVLGI